MYTIVITDQISSCQRPRIVPLHLLKCLKVLLDENGGLLSTREVGRIHKLMKQYSKKIVSKTIYVLILKATKTELLNEFMGLGGWSLVYDWLNDSVRDMIWPLVEHILQLLLICPVDVDRLKINSTAKLVKRLCRDGGNEDVRVLAKRLVEQWLNVVTKKNSQSAVTPQLSSIVTPQVTNKRPVTEDPITTPTKSDKEANKASLVCKVVYKNGQQTFSKVSKTELATKMYNEDQVSQNSEEFQSAGTDTDGDATVDEQKYAEIEQSDEITTSNLVEAKVANAKKAEVEENADKK